MYCGFFKMGVGDAAPFFIIILVLLFLSAVHHCCFIIVVCSLCVRRARAANPQQFLRSRFGPYSCVKVVLPGYD